MAEKAKKKEANPAETEARNKARSTKFVELASKRVSKSLLALRNLGKLASPNYRYTPEQVAKIGAALDGAVADVKSRFTSAPKVDTPTFSL